MLSYAIVEPLSHEMLVEYPSVLEQVKSALLKAPSAASHVRYNDLIDKKPMTTHGLPNGRENSADRNQEILRKIRNHKPI